MADVKWIKIVTDIFDDEKILLIESLPDGDRLLIVWFKLLILAGKQNNSGVFIFSNSMPYTEEMFATIFRRPVATVRLALETFKQFGMVEVVNNAIMIPNWSKHQTLDQIENRNEYMKSYMKTYRDKQKQIAIGNTKEDVNNVNINSKPNNKLNVNSLEEDKEVDKIRDKSSITHIKQHYGEFENVLLTEEEHKKVLARKYGDKAIEKLSAYLASKKTTYKSHYAVLNSWVFNSVEEEEMKKTKFSNGFQKEVKTPNWYEKYEKELKDKNRPKEKVSVDLETLEKSLDETFKTQK